MLLAPGEEVQGHATRYVIERVVGNGAFAAVYAAKDAQTPGRQVALKEFFLPRHPREQASLQALFDRERYVGAQASPHPLMPTFYEAFTFDGHFCIAQEFIVGTTLDEIIAKRHPLPREWILKWTVCLCDALAFLHSRQIVHHDLKPPNIRITPQGHLALLDFGAAQYFGAGHESAKPLELYGTEGYLPPELEEGDGHWAADVRTDIFALGCIIYEMIAGTAPDQENINERSMYVTNSLIQRPNADLNLIRLINKALSYNTEYRYASANDFLLDVRQIAPPVLLVSRKSLRFGEVRRGQTPPPQTVTLYNAGGGEIQGEIKPRAAWLQVPTNSFHGNKQDVPVRVDVSKIAERGQMVTGRLEINSADERDAEGRVVSKGDRWFIECSVSILPSPAHLLLEGLPPGATGLTFSARKGQPVQGTFVLKNDGEMPLEVRLGHGAGSITEGVGRPIEGLTLTPALGTLPAGQATLITVTIPTADLPPGPYETAITVRSSANQTLNVPISLRIQSPLEFLKSKIGGH